MEDNKTNQAARSQTLIEPREVSGAHRTSSSVREEYLPLASEITVRFIQRAICKRYEITLDDMLSDRRSRKIARPRQLAMWLARQLTPYTLPAIGNAFRRDHTTVMAGIARIEHIMATDTERGDEYRALHLGMCPKPYGAAS